MLDPGHGQYVNASPLDGSFYEGTNNYKFALVLKEALLEYEDVEVLMTRNDITENPDLATRGNMAVTEGCDVFLSIHSNASSSSSAYGVEGYYSINTPGAYGLLVDLCHTTSYQFPKPKVRRVVTKVSGGQDYYGVLRASKGVKYSMLIEQGFHTNPKELACIRLDDWHKIVAEQQGKVFANFFKLTKKEVVVEPPVPEEPKEEPKEEPTLASQINLDEIIAKVKDIENEVIELRQTLESYK
jgi:N-acetylmuramoyl-L-alanine amidase